MIRRSQYDRFSSFQVVYGKPTPTIPQFLRNTSPLEAIDSMFTTAEEHFQNYNTISTKLNIGGKNTPTLIEVCPV